MRKITYLATLTLGCGFSALSFAGNDSWYPINVDVWDPPFDMESPTHQAAYTPLEKASKAWDICVSFPHMKDPYWLAVNYGVADEAKRLGVNMQLFEAGAYTNLDTQISQVENCISRGADAVVLAAISYDGLNRLIEDVTSQGIPVIDLINGVSSPNISAKSLVSFYKLGHMAGSYLADSYPEGEDPVKVGWFPGAAGAGWAEDGNRGFNDAIEGSAVEIVDTQYGDASQEIQMGLVENVLAAHPDLDYIIGATTTAEGAANLLRSRGMTGQISVMPYYYSVGVHRGITRGEILAAPTDSAAIQGRIAIDQAVRVLEGEDYMQHVGPELFIISQDNVNSFDQQTSLAPDGWRPVFSVQQ
ncbi:TMAO reductase system periplasmic protein TorT [Halomonas salipaludis]|uniref:TMAO reductase system periplasmic protein TorT n=1 Tax=Halomonas salipaludis TaxID=2032625 RepID=A0A2A2EXD7_9GAMM|nr:TMAO reductase system periplasmic protein TorT [Halomonas salipaludis]PAU77210.1 TMAO reductase system periplasmic protein TorT [Halomonas salipaludis]